LTPRCLPVIISLGHGNFSFLLFLFGIFNFNRSRIPCPHISSL
jgi:hypothetical protein